MTVVHAQKEVIPKVGDNICIQGFIMDVFCIKLGNLLDDPTTVTLSPNGPLQHTVHCLLDIRQCYTSPYEVLNLRNDGTGWFGRAWRLESNRPIIDYGTIVGFCERCDRADDAIREGLRVTMNATVVTLGSNSTPPIIRIIDGADSVRPYQEFESVCGNETVYVPPNGLITTGAGRLLQPILIHGSLMLIGWGLLLPTGAIIARFGKHRPNAWWYKMHRTIQPLGLLFALIAWIIALHNFTTLEGELDGRLNKPHALLGMTTMCIGLVQPINAIFRPHPPKEGEIKSTLRTVWEIGHKGLGWLGILLGVITVAIGTMILQDPDHRMIFQIVYGAVVGSLLVGLVVFLKCESKKGQDGEVWDRVSESTDRVSGKGVE